MALTDNIISYYKFDSGALTTDSVGSNTLTNVNTVGETASGLIGYGADLGSSNTNKAFRLNSSFGLTQGGDKTVSIWAKILTEPTDGQYYYIYYNMLGANPGTTVGFIYTRSGATYYSRADTNSSINSAGDLGTTNFHHFLWSETGGTVTFYLDGSSKGTDTHNSGNYTAYGNWVAMGERYFTGADDGYASIQIDEAAIWNRALDSTEVTSLYNSGSGLQYPFSTSSIKTINGLAKASVKTVNGLAIASVKTWNGLA